MASGVGTRSRRVVGQVLFRIGRRGPVWRRRWLGLGSERGAAATEFAVVSVALLMILMGTFSLGITMYQKIALEGAAREAARFGATYPVEDAGSVEEWLRDVAQVGESAATGTLNALADGRLVCAALGSGDASGFSRIVATGVELIPAASEQPGWCFPNQAPDDDVVVQVQLQRDGWIEAIVFNAKPTLIGEATNQFERVEP